MTESLRPHDKLFLLILEEVPLYTPKGKRAAASNSGYPPGYFPSPSTTATKTKTEKPKPEKPPAGVDKIKAKEKKETVKAKQVDDISGKLSEISLSSGDADPTVEISKKLKRLRKRLRESEQLDEKLQAGESITNSDQLDKIARRQEFFEEIEKLEAERLKLRLKLKAPKAP